MLRKLLLILVAGLIAACGTLPPPAYEQPTLTYEAQERVAVRSTTTAEALLAMQPTRSLGTTVAAAPTVVPTDVPTLVPPTATVVLPTATVAEATTVPTTAPAAAAVEDDPILMVFMGNANATNGAQLFVGTYQAEDGSEWSCATCHNVEGDVVKIGPSLAGIASRAATRMPQFGPYGYLYDSIRNPQDYIVEGFESSALMPHFKLDSLTDGMVYDIIAYLMTLQ